KPVARQEPGLVVLSRADRPNRRRAGVLVPRALGDRPRRPCGCGDRGIPHAGGRLGGPRSPYGKSVLTAPPANRPASCSPDLIRLGRTPVGYVSIWARAGRSGARGG